MKVTVSFLKDKSVKILIKIWLYSDLLRILRILVSQDMRWSCCRMPELEAGGCTELCDLCGQVPILFTCIADTANVIPFVLQLWSQLWSHLCCNYKQSGWGNGHDAWVGCGMWLKISECTSAKSQGANKDIDYEGLGIREALCFDQTPRRKPGKQSSRLRGELSLFKDSQLYSHHVLWYSDQLISSRNDHTGAREGAHSQPPLNQGFSYFLALLWQYCVNLRKIFSLEDETVESK